jgi:hypothetical protein
MVRPPLWSNIDSGYINPYICRTLIRIDEIIWRLRGKRVHWGGPNSGRLYETMGAGHGVELRSHFPGGWFIAAANLQNRQLWTRKVLSL